jgi:hypothetical protein
MKTKSGENQEAPAMPLSNPLSSISDYSNPDG